MCEIIVEPPGRPAFIDHIVLANTFNEILKAGLAHLWAVIRPACDLALSPLEDTPRLCLVCCFSRVVDRTSILVILHPPGSAFRQLSCNWIAHFPSIQHPHTITSFLL